MFIALIPARGGSKRLPRKNLRLFAGRPLVQHTIDVALRVAGIERCFVSTDDAEIATVARYSGAEVIERPADLASDTATTASVAHHAVLEMDRIGLAVTGVVTLQPTSPLRPAWVVSQAMELFRVTEPHSVVSVTRSHRKHGQIVDGWFVPEYEPGTRSQNMPARYFENGVVYVSNATMLRESGEFFGTRIAPLEIDPLYATGDIDDELDFIIAEHVFRSFREEFER